MRRILWTCGAAGMLAVLVLAGACSPGTGAPPVVSDAPSDAPSDASPSAAPTPDASASLDALYREAEAVLRAEFAEEEKLDIAGGAEQLPSAFGAYLMDPYYSVVEEGYRSIKSRGWRLASGSSVSLTHVQARPDLSMDDSLVTIEACYDRSKAIVVDHANNPVDHGIADLRTLYFKRDGNQLKIFYGTSEGKAACDQ